MGTSVLLALFSQNQPYDAALQIPCDVVLEVIETQLDESLSYLEGDYPRLARREIAVTKEHGSVRAYSDLVKSEIESRIKEIHAKPNREVGK